MLEKLRNIKWFDWVIVMGVGLLVVGIGVSWKTENKGKIEIKAEKTLRPTGISLDQTSQDATSRQKVPTIIKQNPSVSTSSTSPLKEREKINSNIININKAGIDDLDKLEGIGPAIAQRIVEYRDQNKGFRDIREIKLVKGIGDKIYEKIQSNLEI